MLHSSIFMSEEFQHIKSLLERYQNMAPPDSAIAALLMQEAKRVGVSIAREDIRVVDGVARIKTSPARKHALFIHTESIVRAVNGKAGKNVLRDIR